MGNPCPGLTSDTLRRRQLGSFVMLVFRFNFGLKVAECDPYMYVVLSAVFGNAGKWYVLRKVCETLVCNR